MLCFSTSKVLFVTVIFKRDNSQGLIAHETVQCSVKPKWEKNLKKVGKIHVYVYITESLCCTRNLTQHCKSTLLQKLLKCAAQTLLGEESPLVPIGNHRLDLKSGSLG